MNSIEAENKKKSKFYTAKKNKRQKIANKFYIQCKFLRHFIQLDLPYR